MFWPWDMAMFIQSVRICASNGETIGSYLTYCDMFNLYQLIWRYKPCVCGWVVKADLQGTRVRIRTTSDFHSAWPSKLSHSLSRKWFTISFIWPYKNILCFWKFKKHTFYLYFSKIIHQSSHQLSWHLIYYIAFTQLILLTIFHMYQYFFQKYIKIK